MRNPNHKFKFLSWLVATKVLLNLYKKTKFADVIFFFGGSAIVHEPASIFEPIHQNLGSPSQIVTKYAMSKLSPPPRFSQRILKKVASIKNVKKKLKRWDSLGETVHRANSLPAVITPPKNELVSPVTSLNLESLFKFRPGGEFSPDRDGMINHYISSVDSSDEDSQEMSSDSPRPMDEPSLSVSSTDSQTTNDCTSPDETPRIIEDDKMDQEETVRQLIMSFVNAEQEEICYTSNRRRSMISRERSPVGKVRAMTPPLNGDDFEVVTRERIQNETYLDQRDAKKNYIDVSNAARTSEERVPADIDPLMKSFHEKLAMFRELERTRNM
jgi:hypothetical protein